MPQISVDFERLQRIAGEFETVSGKISGINADFQNTVRRLDWDIKGEQEINAKAQLIDRRLESYAAALKSYNGFLNTVYSDTMRINQEPAVSLYFRQQQATDSSAPQDLAVWQSAKENFFQNFLKEFGPDLGKNAYEIISTAAVTFFDYKKIGNAVGNNKAMAWFVKNAMGLRPLGRVSTAGSPVQRFLNNLTNKTSPFNWKVELGDTFKTLTGGKGAVKAAAKWGSFVFDGVLNWFDNKDEQANSGGTMSDGRVVAETITETAVDAAFTAGAGIAIGAAVTAAGVVAAPAVAVAAVAGLAVWGINTGVEAATGKTATEWVSDAILDGASAVGKAAVDSAKAMGKAVGDAAKQVTNAVGKWFPKLVPF